MIAIRREEAADVPAIDALLRVAFGGPDEAALVEVLRRDGDLLLSLVATDDDIVVGHVGFSRLAIDGKPAAVALAPLAVLPMRQRQGIGARLVLAGHTILRADGEALSLVLGDPAYYGRFGYDRAGAANFACAYQCDAFQALALGPAPHSGKVTYPPAFAGL